MPTKSQNNKQRWFLGRSIEEQRKSYKELEAQRKAMKKQALEDVQKKSDELVRNIEGSDTDEILKSAQEAYEQGASPSEIHTAMSNGNLRGVNVRTDSGRHGKVRWRTKLSELNKAVETARDNHKNLRGASTEGRGTPKGKGVITKDDFVKEYSGSSSVSAGTVEDLPVETFDKLSDEFRKLHPPQTGLQTNTPITPDDKTEQTIPLQDELEESKVEDHKNTGRFGLPPSGVGGRQGLDDLEELVGNNINDFDLENGTGLQILDDWVAENSREHNMLYKDSGQLAGGEGDVLGSIEESLESFFGEREINDGFNLNSNEKELASKHDVEHDLMYNDIVDGIESNEEREKAYLANLMGMPEEWEETMLRSTATPRIQEIRNLRRKTRADFSRRARSMLQPERLGREYVDPNRGVIGGFSDFVAEASGGSVKSIREAPEGEQEWQSPTTKRRVNQIGLVRQSALNHLKSVNELLPTI